MRKILVIALVLATAMVASANLLLNPSFETAGAGGSWDPADWSRSDGNDRTDISSWGAPWAAQDGDWAMKLSNDGGTPGNHYLGQTVSTALDVGNQAIVSFYALANLDPIFVDAYISIGLTGGAGGDVWQDYNFASGLSNQTFASGWVQYSFTVTNQAVGTDGVEAWINFTGVDAPGGTDILLDSASLTTAIPEPTVAGLLGISGLLVLALRKKMRK